MAEDIAQWLEELGLGRYTQAFADNDVDAEVLPELTDADLKDLGLSLGHRRKLLKAIDDQRLAAAADRPPDPETATPAAEAELRQLTVLFSDLVGSTALSMRLDPEDMRDVIRAYQDACLGVIARYDGYVAKFMGDGVYAYYGYPRAHEDDAERAINAGLEIVEAVGALEHDLQVRIGVATGTVAVGDIVGEGASEEAAIVGEAPNLAGRLQEIAEPDTVVIGEATYALAGGLFETTDLGKRKFKGFADPVRAWSANRPRRMESRFEATRGEQTLRGQISHSNMAGVAIVLSHGTADGHVMNADEFRDLLHREDTGNVSAGHAPKCWNVRLDPFLACFSCDPCLVPITVRNKP